MGQVWRLCFLLKSRFGPSFIDPLLASSAQVNAFIKQEKVFYLPFYLRSSLPALLRYIAVERWRVPSFSVQLLHPTPVMAAQLRSPYLVSMHLARNQQSENHMICTYKDRSNDDDRRIRMVVVCCPDDPILVYCDPQPVICSSGDLGLLLLQWTDELQSWHQSKSKYALWNPATRQVKHLFRPPLEPPYFPDYPEEDDDPCAPPLYQYNDDCGVGLDLVSNVVKVVLVRNYEVAEDKSMSPVYVYTLGGGWRKLTGDYPYPPQVGGYFPAHLCNSTHFKGSIYWRSYACVSQTFSIVTFDLGTEVFRKIEYPIYGFNDHLYCPISGPHIYRDSIAVFATTISSVDVWLLSGSSEGVGELCWIKHSNIIRPLPRELRLQAIFTDDKLVALSQDDTNQKTDLVVFDTRKQQVDVVLPNMFLDGLFTYRETLVCIQ
ncbi:hypothetical protein LINGRAHAP2_LOCUS308 [Linum grandiflorum]